MEFSVDVAIPAEQSVFKLFLNKNFSFDPK